MRPTTVAFLSALALPVAAQNQGIQLANGVDGGVDVPFDPLFVPPTGITVEAWITYDDSTIPVGTYRWPTIARQNISNASEVWLFRVNASNNASRSLVFSVRTPGTGGVTNAVTYAFVAGEFAQFTHLAATYDGQTLSIYKNGVQVATRTLTTTQEIPNNGGNTRIGNGDPAVPGNETWNGFLDELRVWPMARTAAEIQATMNLTLLGVPGNVLTFNLDGHYLDTSHILTGTPFGTIAFVPGPPLTPVGVNGQVVGTSTTTCGRTIEALLGSPALVGNAAFAVWSTRGPRPANSPLALLAAGGLAAPPGQPPFAGVQLAFALPSYLAAVSLVPASGVLGNTRFPLAIPAVPGFVGASFVFQYGYIDSLCGPQGVSASDGIQFAIQ
jgi:hypothetical protein